MNFLKIATIGLLVGTGSLALLLAAHAVVALFFTIMTHYTFMVLFQSPLIVLTGLIILIAAVCYEGYKQNS
jgi:hypothetical protein